MVDPGTVKTGIFLWRLIKPVTRVKRALNKRRARKGKELLEINEGDDLLMAPYNKAIVAVIGVALAVASRWFPGLADADPNSIAQAILLLLTAFGVYQVPNKPAAK